MRESLEEEVFWRTEEIKFFKNQLVNFQNEQEKEKYRKSMVLILYSHLEGFLKVALTTYAQFLNSLNKKRNAFSYNLIATSMDGEFKAYENKDMKCKRFINNKIPDEKKIHNIYRRVNFLESSETLMNQAMFITDSAIDTESNVWYIVLQKNMYRMGLPLDLFQEFEKDIDSLVNRRNSIAHGSRHSGVKEDDYLKWETSVVSIMNEITRKIYSYAVNECYLRANVES